MATIGKVLQQARQHAGLSQSVVARRAGMPVAQLSQIESGRSASPEFVTVARIAAVVGVCLDDVAVGAGLLSQVGSVREQSGGGLLQAAIRAAASMESLRDRSGDLHRRLDETLNALNDAIDTATPRRARKGRRTAT